MAAGDLQERLEEIYGSVNPAVVNIRVAVQPTAAMGNLPQIPGMPNFRGMPNQDNENGDTPNSPMAMGEGSGFVWDNQGHIVTNNHVVDERPEDRRDLRRWHRVPATVVGTDPDSDLAVIKVDSKAVRLQPVKVADSTNVKVGQFVIAIGNPFGLEGTMTFGIVSALGRSLPANGEQRGLLARRRVYTIPDIIQTDAPINPGNSGGVLLDLDGNSIGVPTAIESPVRGSAGVGFAIPSAIVKQVVPELITDGKFVHPWIGISGGTLTPAPGESNGSGRNPARRPGGDRAAVARRRRPA